MPDTHSTDTATQRRSATTDARLIDGWLKNLRKAFRKRDEKRVRSILYLLSICADEIK
jgi:hypothetical protein